MLIEPHCTLELDESNQELNAAGSCDFGCRGFDEFFGHEPGDELAWHWHDGFEAILCIEGALMLSVGSKEVVLEAGAAAFINALRPHSAYGAPQAHIRSVVFSEALVSGGTGTAIARRYTTPLKTAPNVDVLVYKGWSDARGEALGAGDNAGADTGPTRMAIKAHAESDGKSEGGDTGKSFAKHLAQAVNELEIEQPGFEIRVRDHLSQMILLAWQRAGCPGAADSKSSTRSERIERMRAHIAAHYAENLTVSQIADAAGVCERECLRCFTEVLGVSPSRYLLMYRMAKAAELLGSTSTSIADIARAVGIKSPSNFAQLFRRGYHCTPREYRARIRAARG